MEHQKGIYQLCATTSAMIFLLIISPPLHNGTDGAAFTLTTAFCPKTATEALTATFLPRAQRQETAFM